MSYGLDHDREIRSTNLPLSSPDSTVQAQDGGPARPIGLVEVFCDGACSGNPGPGGYGVLVRIPGQPEITRAAGQRRATNNQMEMLGAITGLKIALQMQPSAIAVTTDSQYLVKGMTAWLAGWKRKGWRTASGAPVKNRELWEQLDVLSGGGKVTWRWIRGHAGHPENELCDQLASQAIQEAYRTPG
jgi:ribonuclease HI